MSMKHRLQIKNKINTDSEEPTEEWPDPPVNNKFKDAPVFFGLLPAIPMDNHRNVVPRLMQLEGLSLQVGLWERGSEVNDFETLYVRVNDRPVFIKNYEITDAIPDPVTVDLGPISALQSHGLKDIKIDVVNSSGNTIDYNIFRLYVDAQDPNYGEQPGRILTEDFGLELTPEFLEGKVGLTCTIPNYADRRGGDVYKVFVGSDETETSDLVPLTGPLEVIIPTAVILARSGEVEISYSLMDRAGNVTVLSLPKYITVRIDSAPVFGGINVIGAPLIDKEEAREGVKVQLLDLTDYQNTDFLQVLWHGVEISNQPISSSPFPREFTANYLTVSGPGVFYTADVQCIIHRQGSSPYPSGIENVDVDLREPGIGNPGAGPVDPALPLPLVLGGGPGPSAPNHLLEKDRDFDAVVQFELAPGLESGDLIHVYYGTEGGTLASTYPVTGTEADPYTVVLSIQWDIIDSYGNGMVPCYYEITDAVNYKHSPSQDVTVEIFSLVGLVDPVFSSAIIVVNPNFQYFINCAQQPWLGVPIKVFDPATLEIGDELVIEAVRYNFGDPVTPVGDPIESSTFILTSSEVNLGLTVPLNLNVWLEDVTSTGGRGYVSVRWKIYRPSNGDRGVSDVVTAAWDVVGTGGGAGTCIPGATRNKGTF